MYFFDKKTEYLVWKMQEGQARGVGTVKFLAMDDVCRMEISLTGCGNIQGKYPVYVVSGDLKSLIGEITLNKGKGNLYLKSKTKEMGHLAIPYGQVTGLHIDLKTGGCLEQKWLPLREEPVESEAKKEVRVEPEAEVIETPDLSTTPETEAEPDKSHPADSATPRPADTAKPPVQEKFNLYPNKWQQLCAIYPVVHPFGDGRAYLSIEPRDFVVLQERFQPMVQNSFLLHGFYHYRHLLLGRQQQGKNIQYFLGVPGVFYEKEKAAALFYGFESFEGAVTPAQEGSFGYYMKRVQL